MNKEFFDKHSEELECACCEFLKECVEIYDRPLCKCGYTKYLEDKLALTEKALELACEECLSFICSDYCTNKNECEDCFYKKEYTPEKFKAKAKEMKSER